MLKRLVTVFNAFELTVLSKYLFLEVNTFVGESFGLFVGSYKDSTIELLL